MSRKIALLNFYFANKNYGAVLQAAALQSFLKNEGYSPINIKLMFVDKRGKLRKFLSSLLFKTRQFVFPRKYYVVANQQAFSSFRAKWVADTQESYTYKTISGFAKKHNDTVAYIVGSDQIWRPSYTAECAMSYFLDFVQEPVTKVAYAASFGKDEWEFSTSDSFTSRVKELLNRFNAVSVREKTGQQICEQVFQTDALHVLDPTLLVGRKFFDQIIADDCVGPQKDQIVYYKLDPNDDFMSAISFLKTKYGCQAENIYFQEKVDNGRVRREYNDVSLWLAKLRDAKLIVTDSYHCVCFAILFNKPFIAFSNESRGKARFDSLFSLLGLDSSSLYLSNGRSIINGEYSLIHDFSDINDKIITLRKSSSEFLLSSLPSNK